MPRERSASPSTWRSPTPSPSAATTPRWFSVAPASARSGRGDLELLHELLGLVGLDGDPEGVAGSGIASKVRILYKWTNVYEEPDNTLLNGVFYDPTNAPIWIPKLSTVGPEAATSYITPAANTTYYTAYLVTQLYMDKSADDDYGNLEEAFTMRFNIEEPKTGFFKLSKQEFCG